MPLNDLPASRRDKARDDAVRLRDLLRGVRGAKADARDFALFDVRDQLRGLGVPVEQIDAFDAHDDDALSHHIGQAHAVATALGAADDEDHSALFGDTAGVGAARPPLRNIPGARLPGIVQSDSERIYRPLFISPDDAQNPGDRLQIVPAGNASDEDMAKIDRSIRYLNQSPLARRTIDEGLRRGVRITPNGTGHDAYQNNPAETHFRDVAWDPGSQLRLLDDDGSLSNRFQSPAMGLLHEFGHALQPPVRANSQPEMDAAGKAEEQRVRLGLEMPVARELGEGVRTNHSGDLFRTDDPATWKPGRWDERSEQWILDKARYDDEKRRALMARGRK